RRPARAQRRGSLPCAGGSARWWWWWWLLLHPLGHLRCDRLRRVVRDLLDLLADGVAPLDHGRGKLRHRLAGLELRDGDAALELAEPGRRRNRRLALAPLQGAPHHEEEDQGEQPDSGVLGDRDRVDRGQR